jgi:hypothetical protein
MMRNGAGFALFSVGEIGHRINASQEEHHSHHCKSEPGAALRTWPTWFCFPLASLVYPACSSPSALDVVRLLPPPLEPLWEGGLQAGGSHEPCPEVSPLPRPFCAQSPRPSPTLLLPAILSTGEKTPVATRQTGPCPRLPGHPARLPTPLAAPPSLLLASVPAQTSRLLPPPPPTSTPPGQKAPPGAAGTAGRVIAELSPSSRH